ncbi:MAG: calcium-binding protein [Pseudomonadota bacterium]
MTTYKDLNDAPHYMYIDYTYLPSDRITTAYIGYGWDSLYGADFDGYSVNYTGNNFSSEGNVLNIALQPDLTGINSSDPNLNAVTSLDTDDYFITDSGNEAIYSAEGDDVVRAWSGDDTVVGGWGNDELRGEDGNDQLYGDWADLPIYTFLGYDDTADESWNQNDWNMPNYRLDLPQEYTDITGDDTLEGGDGDDTVHAGPGDDVLRGGDGSDQLFAGDGNDELHGGPRNDGDLDLLVGGDGSDIFYLSYAAQPADPANASWWSQWGSEAFVGGADAAVKDFTTRLLKSSASTFFADLPGSVIASAFGGIAGEGAKLGFASLLGETSAAPTPSGNENVMVVQDFDPRYDVLALPVSSDVTLTADAIYYDSYAFADDKSYDGYALKFTDGDDNHIYAEVFFADAYLADLGLDRSNAAFEGIIESIYRTSLSYDQNGLVTSSATDPFSMYEDPANFVDGEVPTGIGATVVANTPQGTTTHIYGAFAPVALLGPSLETSVVYASGTQFGDIIFVTTRGFAPDDWALDGPGNAQQITLPSQVFGFEGDDILNGSDGEDYIYGGDGDDLIYGWQNNSTTGRDYLDGGDGDDELFAARTSNGSIYAHFVGGAGSDTASFEYSYVSISANLSITSGDLGEVIFEAVENLIGTNQPSTYDLTSESGLRGDTLAGDDSANQIHGLAGDDSLLGRGDADTLNGGVGDDTLDGGDGNDYLDGGATLITPDESNSGTDVTVLGGDDSLLGGDGDDALDGRDGDDTLDGGADDDFVRGGSGADSLVGGFGNDTVGYDDQIAAVYVWLGNQQATDGYGDQDTLEGFENVVGSGLGDTLYGSGDANLIEGGDGNDTLAGASGGEDTLTGGAGNDILYGSWYAVASPETDTAIYSGNYAGFTFSSSFVAASGFGALTVTDINAGDGDEGSDFMQGIEVLQFADQTVSSIIANFDGTTPLIGTSGPDLLFGFDEDETLEGGAGDDWNSGGLGTDTAVYSGDIEGYDFALFQSDYMKITDTDASDGDDGVDTLLDIEVLRFGTTDYGFRPGTSASDSLTGTDGDDIFFGFDGNDTLEGLAGDDTLSGAEGDDTLLGGDGADRARYQGNLSDFTLSTGFDSASGTYRITLTDTNTADGLDEGTDEIEGIETLQFADTALGVLLGTDAADTLIGGAIPDLIFGWGGDDSLVGGSGADTIDGGDGVDTVDFGAGTSGITVDFRATDPDDPTSTIVPDDGLGDQVTLRNIEQVVATPFDDTLVGVTPGTRFFAGAGDDSIEGSSGQQVTVDYSRDPGGIIANLNDDTLQSDQGSFLDGLTVTDGWGGIDRLEAIHSIVGTAYADTLFGSSSGDLIETGAGDDSVRPGSGNDMIDAGSGNDTVYASEGTDTLDGGDGTDTLDFSTIADQFGSLEYLNVYLGSGGFTFDDGSATINGFENVIGSSGGDAIYGDDNDNVIRGGQGFDTLDGGGGFDTVDYSTASNGVFVDLETGNGNDGDFGSDEISGFEAVLGSDHNDTLQGSEAGDLLQGGAGSDSLSGGSEGGPTGDDTLNGGAGDDSLDGQDGADVAIYGGLLADFTFSSSGSTIVVTDTNTEDGLDEGTDTLSNIEFLQFADRTLAPVFGDDGANNLVGSNDASDFMLGFGGDDTLNGGLGDDILKGGDGNDLLEDGGGMDVAVFSNAIDTYTFSWDASGRLVVTGEGTDTVGNGVELLQFGDQVFLQRSGDILNDSIASRPDGNSITFGRSGNDTITSLASDWLFGNEGNDTLLGQAENDGLVGGDGNDSLAGGSGDDTLRGDAGDDSVDGGEGTDQALFRELVQNPVYDTTDPNTIQIQSASGSGTDTISNVEILTFGWGQSDSLNTADGKGDFALQVGTDGSETLTGGSGGGDISYITDPNDPFGGVEAVYGSNGPGNILIGGPGDDVLQGMIGEDGAVDIFIWSAGDGADRIIGGGGIDTTILNLAGENLEITTAGDQEVFFLVSNDNIVMEQVEELVINDAGTVSGAGNLSEAGVSQETVRVNMADGDHSVDFSGLVGGVGSIIRAGDGRYTFHGGDGDDVLRGGSKDDTIHGGAGDDVIRGGGGTDTKFGGDGTDTFVGDHADFANGGFIGDLSDGERLIIEGHSGAVDLHMDEHGVVTATIAADGGFAPVARIKIEGDFSASELGHLKTTHIGGDTHISLQTPVATEQILDGGATSRGNDQVHGSREADVLFGGMGDDTLDGNGGNDVIWGGAGGDHLRGEEGDDFVLAGRGNDFVDAGAGGDWVVGGYGRDTVKGEGGDDRIKGGRENDWIDSGDGKDTVWAGHGDDYGLGGAGDDAILGGRGNDTVIGGFGSDMLEGGHGIDTFVLAQGEGTDIILDFTIGEDLIGLGGGISDNDLTLEDSNIMFGEQTLAVLVGIESASFSDIDFVLV